jgi:heat shock protein HtpX
MYKQIEKNKRTTILILIGFVVLISAIGTAFAYLSDDIYIAIFTGAIALVYALFQYFAAGKLAVMMTGAKEIDKKSSPRLYKTVENLSISTGLPMPKVYIIKDPAPNAFATGRDPAHSSVAATTGLLDIMDDKELTAIMAHEMSHIKNYDILVSTIVFGLVCIIGLLADLGSRMLFLSGGRGKDNDSNSSPVGIVLAMLTMILAPIAATLAQLAVSRQREYLADSSAALITRYPEGMISALRKLEAHARPMRQQNAATEALFISNPLKKSFSSKIFSTHPPIEDRIKRLENGKKSF